MFNLVKIIIKKNISVSNMNYIVNLNMFYLVKINKNICVGNMNYKVNYCKPSKFSCVLFLGICKSFVTKKLHAMANLLSHFLM